MLFSFLSLSLTPWHRLGSMNSQAYVKPIFCVFLSNMTPDIFDHEWLTDFKKLNSIFSFSSRPCLSRIFSTIPAIQNYRHSGRVSSVQNFSTRGSKSCWLSNKRSRNIWKWNIVATFATISRGGRCFILSDPPILIPLCNGTPRDD